MEIDLDEQDGQTPLDPDERAGLIPQHLSTRGDLNEWEQENILQGLRWMRRTRSPDVLSEGFCRLLHAKMFDQTWSWAGTFRKSDKNIGCDWAQVGVKLAHLFGNAKWWVSNDVFPIDEIAARFHRDLVWIHPFPNGNGRHSRMMSDALLRSLGRTAFSWGGGGNLVAASEVRARYLTALRSADQGNYQPLLEFVRS